MGGNKPLSIRATLWLVIALTVTSTLLGTGALHGYQLYQRAEAAETMRIRTLAEAYAIQAGIWLNQSRESLKDGINRLEWHPDVCVLAVVGGMEGSVSKSSPAQPPQIIAVRGDKRLVESFLKDPQAKSSGLQRLAIPLPPGSRRALWSPLYLAAAPMLLPGSTRPTATLICGARSSSGRLLTPRAVLVFFGRLLLLASSGVLMGFWWLKRSVIEPLAHLADRSTGMASIDVARRIQDNRDDEIGDVARALSELHISLEEWRERALRLERNVNQRVACETKRVSRKLKRVQREVWIDALTQLGNRRMLEDRFDELFAGQSGAGNDLSIVMFDVDNFKKLNDTKGHAAGDELLRFIGELLKQSLREQDMAVRYGGDEFMLVLPSVTLRDAERIAQRTVLLFNQQCKLLAIELKPSLSGGVASLWEHKAQNGEELMAMADRALYQAKHAGKSCVRTLQTQARSPELVASQ